MEQEKIKETPASKLRNLLTPIYTLAEMVLSIPETSNMVPEQARLALKNKEAIKEVLNELDVAPTPPSVAPTEEKDEGCTCQGCGNKYKIDVTISDELWSQISPKQVDGFKGGGLLCPTCIFNRLEEKFGFNHFSATNREGSDYDIQRLYSWIMDENRQPAQTFFTSGNLRNVAKEIEFRLNREGWVKVEEMLEFLEWIGDEEDQSFYYLRAFGKHAWVNGDYMSGDENELKREYLINKHGLTTKELYDLFKTSK